MEFAPINLTDLIAVTLGISTVLIPIAGLTARFALKPLVDALVAARTARTPTQEVALLEKRIELLEKQLEARRMTLEDPLFGHSTSALSSFPKG